MRYFLSKHFEKQFKKLPKKMQGKTIEQLAVFITDPMDYRLNNHPFMGEWAGCRSINITGDIRAVYKQIDKHTVRFTALGSHSELYS